MTIKYGRLNNRRPCSQDYRKPREDERLAPRQIPTLSVAANELLRHAACGVNYHSVRYGEDGACRIVGDHKRTFNTDTLIELYGMKYVEPFDVYYMERIRIDVQVKRKRFFGYRLTNKGRVASDYLNGRRGSYGD